MKLIDVCVSAVMWPVRFARRFWQAHRKLSLGARSFLYVLLLSSPYIFYQASLLFEPRPEVIQRVPVIVGDTEVTVERLLLTSFFAVGLVAWAAFLSVFSMFGTSRGLYHDYVFSSRIRWMMRIGAANALLRGVLFGFTTFVLIVLGSLASVDVLGAFLGPEVEKQTEAKKHAFVPAILLMGAVYGIIVGLGYIIFYILRGFAVVCTYRDNAPHEMRVGVSVTSKPVCLVIGIPLTLALLLLAPKHLARGLYTAWEMLSPVRDFFRHPWRGLTKEYRENQVLRQLYPEVFGEPDQ